MAAMTSMSDVESPSQSEQPRAPAPKRSWWRKLLWTLFSLFVITIIAVYWLLMTGSGLSSALSLVSVFTGGMVSAQRVSGSLWDKPQLADFKLTRDTIEVKIDTIALDWTPGALWRRSLQIKSLVAGTVDVVQPSAQEPGKPMQAPTDLGLPLSLQIDKLQVAAVTLRHSPQADPDLSLHTINGRLSSDGHLHKIASLDFVLDDIRAQLDGDLAGNPPFVLNVRAKIDSEREGRAFSLQADVTGNLEALTLDLESKGILSGKIDAIVTPFASRPFTRANIALSGINPADFVSDAPVAQLDLNAHIAPADELRDDMSLQALPIAGTVDLVNHQPGVVDDNRLPVRKIDGRMEWRDGVMTLDSFVAVLGGDRESGNTRTGAAPDGSRKKSGQKTGAPVCPALGAGTVTQESKLEGQLVYKNNELLVTAQATTIDAALIHRAAQPTQISGPIQVQLSPERIGAQAELNDPCFALKVDLVKQDNRLDIQKLVLGSRHADEPGQIELTGHLLLDGQQTFALTGKLAAFDPSRYFKSPPAVLNASLNAQGNIQPDPRVKLGFDLSQSQLAGLPLQGNGEATIEGQRLAASDIKLQLGANRLEAQGAFGKAGDRLAWKIDAPSLNVADINGDVVGKGQLSGGLDSLALAFDISSNHLRLPDGIVLEQLKASGEVADNESSPMTIDVSLTRLDRAQEKGVLSNAMLSVDGNRRKHQLLVKTGLTGKRKLEAMIEGGLTQQDKALNWRGTVQKFVLDGDQPVRLLAPAPLTLSAKGVELREVGLAGKQWASRIERLRYIDGKLETSGSLSDLPFAMLLPPSLADRSSLRFNGKWSINIPRIDDPSQWSGEIDVARQDGDFILSELDQLPLYYLGIAQLQARIALTKGRLDASFDTRGERLGEIHFNGNSRIDTLRGDDAVKLAQHIPWQGKLTLDMPSLSWLSSMINENIDLAGRVNIQAVLAGTPAEPVLTGQVVADQLAVALLDQGLRLERGRIDVGLQGTRIHVNQADIFGVLYEKPDEMRIDYEALRSASAGARKATLSGDIDLHSLNGMLTLNIDRLPLLQQPGQWLMLSGQSQLKFENGRLAVQGKFNADAGFWQFAAGEGMPQLSDDVEVLGRRKAEANPIPVAIDVEADFGRRFFLRGAGVDTRLTGSIRMTGSRGQTPRAEGSIRTVDGFFDAYGTRLDIKRGIANFHGLIDNPGLNIYAARQIQAVEAGVEVSGTMQRPTVKLVSIPAMPDAEILSWIISGHGTDVGEGVDSGMLFSAASAILGQSGVSPSLKQSLGIDEFSVGSGTLGGSGQQTTSRVASSRGFGSNDGNNDQLLSAGKRIAQNMVLGYEHSLDGLGSLVKLTINLNRRLDLIVRTGSDSAVDLSYTFSFGKKRRATADAVVNPADS